MSTGLRIKQRERDENIRGSKENLLRIKRTSKATQLTIHVLDAPMHQRRTERVIMLSIDVRGRKVQNGVKQAL